MALMTFFVEKSSAQDTHGRKLETSTKKKKKDIKEKRSFSLKSLFKVEIQSKPSAPDNKKLMTENRPKKGARAINEQKQMTDTRRYDRIRSQSSSSNQSKIFSHTKRKKGSEVDGNKIYTSPYPYISDAPLLSKKLNTHSPRSERIKKSQVDGDKLNRSPMPFVDDQPLERKNQYTHTPKRKRAESNQMNENKLFTFSPKRKRSTINDAKLQTHIARKDRARSTQVDGSKLMTINKKSKSQMDDKLLFTHVDRASKSRGTNVDGDKLYTHTPRDKKKAYWDNDKLLSLKMEPKKDFNYSPKETSPYVFIYGPAYVVYKFTANKDISPMRKKQYPFDANITGTGNMVMKMSKPKKQKLDDKKLQQFTPAYASKLKMKQNTNEIERFEGNYKLTRNRPDDAHPATALYVNNTQASAQSRNAVRKFSVFWLRIWNPNPHQSKSAKKSLRTNRKPKYDKDERKIWQEDTRHPKPKAELAEID